MNTRQALWMGLIAAACLGSTTAQGQNQYRCPARYHYASIHSDIAPGSIDTQRDTPCLVSRHVVGIPRQKVPQAIGPIRVVEPPKHGRVLIENRAAFIYKPAPGYTGPDSMLIRFMHNRKQAGGFVRFDINVN